MTYDAAGGEPQFDLVDCKVAAWTSDGNWGTAVDVAGIQLVSNTLNLQVAEGSGDGKLLRVASRVRAGTVNLRMLGWQGDIFEVLFNIASDDYGTTPNRIKSYKFEATCSSWVGICGKAVMEECDEGDLHIFIPKCKVAADLTWSFEDGTYAIPETEFRAVQDEVYGIVHVVTHETAVDVAIPPSLS